MTERRRLAFVVHRYGRGGAERLCQSLAERLSLRHDVTVLTTCALDHTTWANALPPGEQVERGVRVRRYPTEPPRPGAVPGPRSPELLAAIERDGTSFDVVFFVTYLYEPTVLGLPLVADRAVLIPTSHDEPEIRHARYRALFEAPRHIVYMTPAERRLVHALFANENVPSSVCAVALDPVRGDGNRFRASHRVVGDLLVYVGRVEASKRCDELVDWVRGFAGRRRVTLALLGQDALRLPSAPPLMPLGHVSEEEKHDALDAASLFVMPSPFESLSIVVLEAWQHGRAVLANGRSAVLRDHILSSQGGLHYEGPAEFASCVDYLLDHPDVRDRMGQNGRAYVDANFTWDRIDATYERIVESVAS